MKKFYLVLVIALFPIAIMAQEIRVTGTVTDAADGTPLPGAYVRVKGTNTGTASDANGFYQLTVPSTSTLVFSSIGYVEQEIPVNNQSVINVTMSADVVQMTEVVVTALGISREKKSLGYATQEVTGEQVSAVKTDNFINSLSGKVSGVQIRRTTNFGGSTNIVVRGNKSLTGNNQTLFVVDGVPISNDITNTDAQSQARTGYDFGNAASDINPEDIESINILKGAAATALYGSRAANGVVMITTKKGATKQGVGVSINSSFTIGSVDKSTFPAYQKQYGGGYGPFYSGPGSFWYLRDINGDGVQEQWVVTSEDASYGAPFDPNLLVYQWDAVDPESPNYLTATPWVAAKNGPITFFEKPKTYVNSVAIEGAGEKGAYRLSYTNFFQDGLLPNSELTRHNVLLNGSWNVNSKLTASASANYIKTDALGRNSTGYSDNIMGMFRQWFQTNVDIQDQKDAYFRTRRNITWNYADPASAVPIYWDNPYWTRYENYETDARDRYVGYLSLTYKVLPWLELFGRASADVYNALEEERRAVGSVPAEFGIGTSGIDGSIGRSDQGSGYMRRDITSGEYNFDLLVNINKDLTEFLNLKATLGTNINRSNYNRIITATNGGLSIPEIYSLQNSVNALPYPKELASKVGVDGIFGSLSLGFRNTLFFDATLRRDRSSTLPEEHSIYYYPSFSASLLFSELIDATWLTFGKIRLNYAEVGNGAGFDQIVDRYNVLIPLNSPMSSVANTKRNEDLRPELTKSVEGGFELFMFERRLGLDLALYHTNTVNQILPLTMTTATGRSAKIINAGEIENKGIELTLSGTPVRTSNLTWNIAVTWTKNKNEVKELLEGVDNLQLGSFQGGITINARVGEPYGVIFGSDYTYHENGQRLIDAANGQYLKTSTSDNVIGDVNPDWNSGILNSITFRNLSLSFLIDIQKGGDIFSLDLYYGLATGLYEETAFINDLGNPVRLPVAEGGGMINKGVNEDGSPNQTRINTNRYGAFGYARGLPDRAFVYDAGYVKLREVTLTYTLPSRILGNSFIKGASVGFIGSNLWIIDKNLPHADPESGLGAGNLQGYSTGSLPSTRDFGFNVKLNF